VDLLECVVVIVAKIGGRALLGPFVRPREDVRFAGFRGAGAAGA
jgi:hypothetical protein